MKLIVIDNFDRDYVGDILVAENVNKYYGETICKLFNYKYGGTEDYMELVEDDYELKECDL